MEEERPDPDRLLAEWQASNESSSKVGKLKIFLGMCPGVGKTYAMLEAAQMRLQEGVDVVIGVVETHGRPETAQLLQGMEIVPQLAIQHREQNWEEMNLDAILFRRPQLVLVDELAHSNVTGTRHPKRYQDVLELLKAGISVYSTLNIQHVESRVEVVEQITGVPIRERVPDSVLDRAEEIALIDVTPDHLRQRLTEGKIYGLERAPAAATNFFRYGNLTALREMALRFTAERVNQEMREFMRDRKIAGPWKSSERLMVGIGPSPFSESLIRWTRRVATSLNASWVAAYIDTGLELSDEQKNRVVRNLGLARQLGAEVLSVPGESVGPSLIRCCQENHATQIVVGKPFAPWWIRLLRGGTLVDYLLQHSGDIDVYVVRPHKNIDRPTLGRPRRPAPPGSEWLAACCLFVGTTLLGWLLKDWMGYWSVALLYLLSEVSGAMVLGRWPILGLALVNALAWDYLFIPPQFTFYISQSHDVMMLIMMFVVALAMGHLTSRLRSRELIERERQRRTEAMLKLTQATTLDYELDAGLTTALRQIASLFEAHVALTLRVDSNHQLETKSHPASDFSLDGKEWSVAAWCFEKNQEAGRFTDTLPLSKALHLPLCTRTSTMGVLSLHLAEGKSLDLNERNLIQAFASQLALALEKDHFRQAVQRAELLEQSDRLRRTLLDNVSHELQTPVAAITVALDGLENRPSLPEIKDAYLAEIRLATQRLQKVVGQLLASARLETGMTQPKKVWCDLAELIHTAQKNCASALVQHPVRIDLPNVPSIQTDPDLFEQVVMNLLVNAGTHTPPGTAVEVSAELSGGQLRLLVRDHGPGLPDAVRVFEKFFRGSDAGAGGLGLGLPIAKGLIRALGGEIQARNPPEGGAEFTLLLPVETRHIT